MNTIVGAGIIGIPYAFKQSGWIAGLLLLAFVGYLTDASLRIIINLATFHPKLRHFHVRTYEKLASFPFGSTVGRGFVLTNMFILAYGAMVAYLLIIKDTVPTLIFNVAPNKYEGLEREIILIGTSLIIILPLSMSKVSRLGRRKIKFLLNVSFPLSYNSIEICVSLLFPPFFIL